MKRACLSRRLGFALKSRASETFSVRLACSASLTLNMQWICCKVVMLERGSECMNVIVQILTIFFPSPPFSSSACFPLQYLYSSFVFYLKVRSCYLRLTLFWINFPPQSHHGLIKTRQSLKSASSP